MKMMTTKEYCGQSPLETAAKLVSDGKCETRLVPKACCVSRASVVCGTKTVKAGHPVDCLGGQEPSMPLRRKYLLKNYKTKGVTWKGGLWQKENCWWEIITWILPLFALNSVYGNLLAIKLGKRYLNIFLLTKIWVSHSQYYLLGAWEHWKRNWAPNANSSHPWACN